MTALAVTLSVTFVFAIALALPIIMVLALIVLIGVFAVLVVLIPVFVVVIVFLFSACGRRRWRQLGRSGRRLNNLLGRRARRRRSAFVILGRCAGTRISGACQRGQSANKQSHSGYRKRKKAELL